MSEEGRDERLLKAKSDALRLLSFSARSVEELRKRLVMKKYSTDIIDDVVDSFKRQGLLNDEKFAELFAHSRVYSRPSGKKKLAFELQKKGISKEVAAGALARLGDYDEKKAAKELVFTRFQKMTGISNEKKKTRIYGFLSRRGFSNDAIFSALKELFREGDSLYPQDENEDR